MILAKLKEATKEQHKNLENTVNVMDRMFSLDDYKDLLIKFYRFYSSIEPVLSKLDWQSIGYDFDDRLKTPKLERDLKNLGVFDDTVNNLEKWDDLPPLNTHAKGIGSLYVLEGATLGGQVIKRHLQSHLGLNPENGGEFFSGYGEMTGPMWKEFGMTATKFAESSDDDDSIVDSAKRTFDSFKKCFEDSAAKSKKVSEGS